MTADTNMCYQAFNHWLGQTTFLDEKFLANINITSDIPSGIFGEVRALFEYLSQLRPAQRQQVVQWGVWVQDMTLLYLLNWSLVCVKRSCLIGTIDSHSVSHTEISLKRLYQLDDVTQTCCWRKLLFTPYPVKMLGVGVNHSLHSGDAPALFYVD